MIICVTLRTQTGVFSLEFRVYSLEFIVYSL